MTEIQLILMGFCELNLPDREVLDGKIQWCVSTTGNGFFYLTNDGSFTVVNLLSSTVGLLGFDTHAAAHLHAYNYYTSHGELYPYCAEYRQAVNEETGSRVMTFKS